ncbi:MAG: transglutaminase domain-containing protein [Muribaculaceae bacterium]|nr:transglutaminase domain-containing protein [Muribaculaceae bacterium]
MAILADGVRAFAADDNVFVAERDVICQLSARDSLVTGATISQNYRMGARRVDDIGIVAAFYDRSSKVENASCTGGKPQYRAWENDDIFYSGTRVCLLPVDVKTGKTSQARVGVSYKNPELLDDIMLMSSLYDIDKEQVTVRIPAEVAARVTVDIFNATGREKMVRDVDGKGNVTVTVTTDSVKAFRREAMMPAPAASMPMVRVNAAFTGLDELYSYLRTKLEALDAPDADIAGLAARLALEAGADTLAQVNAVAGWVRENIRYVAIEHGELAHKPVAASEVLRNRYGDCKGSANLICALLRAMGIDGRRVWVGTKGGVATPFSVSPSLGSANHMIAAAVVGDSIVYLDGTVRNAPRGFVPQAIAGQECLIEDGDSYLLTHVCGPYPEESILFQTGRLEIDDNKLCGEMRYHLGGMWRCMVETAMTDISAGHRAQALATFLSHSRKSITIGSANLLPADSSDAPTSTIAATICDNEGVKAVKARTKLYVMPRLLEIAIPQTVDARNRKWPVCCDDFLPVKADVVIDLPEGYVPDRLPRVATVDNPWFEGHVTYTAEGDTAVRCRAALRQRRQHAGAHEAQTWNDAVRQIEKASNTALVLLHSGSE